MAKAKPFMARELVGCFTPSEILALIVAGARRGKRAAASVCRAAYDMASALGTNQEAYARLDGRLVGARECRC